MDTPIQTVKNDAEGNVHFTKTQNFKLEDVGKTFTYVIKEDKGNIAGVTYDGHEEVITVSVSDNGNGTLNVTADKAMINSPVQFSNVYNAGGGIVLSATKAFAPGAKMPSGREFTFVLKEGETVLDRKSVTGAGSVAFETIKYALTPGQGEYAIGEHTYTIEEVRPDGATAKNNYTYQGVIYDPTVYTVKVNVTDTASGKLKTTINGTEQATFGVTFTNDYKVKETDISVNGKKVLKGKTLEAGMFTFTLEAADNATSSAVSDGIVVLPSNLSVQNTDAEGNFAFESIIFKAEGDYSFKIKEDATTKIDGVQYSLDEYIVKVAVREAGQLEATKEITLNDGNVKEIKFINYFAENSINLEATKVLKGRTLAAEQFEFQLKDEADNVLQTKKNDGSGKISFDKITYKLTDLGTANSKVYTYKINEVVPEEDGAGYKYDRTIKTVNVTVTADREAGTLTVTSDYVGGAATFTNEYEAEGTVKFGGSKKITGRKFLTEDDRKFQAVLKNEAGDVLQTKDITIHLYLVIRAVPLNLTLLLTKSQVHIITL